MTGTPRARADCAVAGTDCANNGPRMISAPSSSACCVPCCAPCGLPPSSLNSSWILGFWNSASAISAAFRIDCAARAALPAADSGRITPTLTCPVPATSGGCGAPEGPGADAPNGLVNWLRLPEQAPSSGAPRIRPSALRRVAPEGEDVAGPGPEGPDRGDPDLKGPESGSSGLTIAFLLSTGPRGPRLSANDQDGWIQAYCRRIINQNKRFLVLRPPRRLQGLHRYGCPARRIVA